MPGLVYHVYHCPAPVDVHAAAALGSFSAIGDQERARLDFLVPVGLRFLLSSFFLTVFSFRPSSFSTAWTAGGMAGSGSSALRSATAGTVRMSAPAQKNPDLRLAPSHPGRAPACGLTGRG